MLILPRCLHLIFITLFLGALALADPLRPAKAPYAPKAGDIVRYGLRQHLVVDTNHDGSARLVPLKSVGSVARAGAHLHASSVSGGMGGSKKDESGFVVAHAHELHPVQARPIDKYFAQHRLRRIQKGAALKEAHKDAADAHAEAHSTHLAAQTAHETAARHFLAHGNHAAAHAHLSAAEMHAQSAEMHRVKSDLHREAIDRVKLDGSQSHIAALSHTRQSVADAHASNERGQKSKAHAEAATALLEGAAHHDFAAFAHQRAGNVDQARVQAQRADAHRARAALHSPGSAELPNPVLSKTYAEGSVHFAKLPKPQPVGVHPGLQHSHLYSHPNLYSHPWQ